MKLIDKPRSSIIKNRGDAYSFVKDIQAGTWIALIGKIRIASRI